MTKNIREEIRKGYTTEYLSKLLRDKYGVSKIKYPNSWDTKFLCDILSYKDRLSAKQIDQIERILGDEIFEQEYPNGIDDLINAIEIITEGKDEYPVLQKKDLLKAIIKLGFKSFKPRTSSWHYALVSTNNNSSLYLLVNKRGIDIKFYENKKETNLDKNGKLYTGGGVLIRNYYNRSKTNIHSHILKLAHLFIKNKKLDESFFTQLGTSPLPPRGKDKGTSSHYTDNYMNTDNEMVHIYNAICHEDGEDAYLGDGVYIRSDGSLYES